MKVRCPLCKGDCVRATEKGTVARRYRCTRCGALSEIAGDDIALLFVVSTIVIGVAGYALTWRIELPPYALAVGIIAVFALHRLLVPLFARPKPWSAVPTPTEELIPTPGFLSAIGFGEGLGVLVVLALFFLLVIGIDPHDWTIILLLAGVSLLLFAPFFLVRCPACRGRVMAQPVREWVSLWSMKACPHCGFHPTYDSQRLERDRKRRRNVRSRGSILLEVVALGIASVTFERLPMPRYVRFAVFTVLLVLIGLIDLLRSKSGDAASFSEVDASDPSVSWLAQLQTEATLCRLNETGLAVVSPWLRDATDESLLVLLQHPRRTDLVAVRAARDGSRVECLRRRADGTWLETAEAPAGGMGPPHPKDERLDVRGHVDPLLLWRLHLARAARDPMASVTAPVSNALTFQIEYRRRLTETQVAAGLRRHTRKGRARLTLRGALLTISRELSPRLWLRSSRAVAQLAREVSAPPRAVGFR